MKYFKKQDLLNSIKIVCKKLDELNKNNYFLEICDLLHIEKDEVDAVICSDETNSLLECLFILWYESGLCEDFSQEVRLLIIIDNIIDELNVSRIEFQSYITKQEKLIPIKS